MNKLHILRYAALVVAAAGCSAEAGPDTDLPAPTATTAQVGLVTQGIRMQGMRMQGMRMQGMTMQGIRLTGATLNNKDWQLRIEKGELVATRSGNTVLRGASLVGMHVFADVHNLQVTPPATAVAEYRITAIQLEDSQYDPTATGNTYLYTLEQYVTDTATWAAACPTDTDGRNVAIALNAIWDDSGARVESTTQFTFGCTIGVIAKCYRWGYRPWVTGYGDLVSLHQTCTRMARADYCGNGIPHTQDGTWINIWDLLPPPGPIEDYVGKPRGMTFEAGWNQGGAVCLSRARWRSDQTGLYASQCPDRLIPHGTQAACDTVVEALGYAADVKLFNESYINATP